ncbi:hypothetical protein HNR26_003883 [Rhizobium rosettiformans]|uniref:Discoidin domain-containing protein n=2 Tax=Rhizobium rosettiformans TaxID=1368430 RepID=A0A4S8PT32_9HYPH|nr:discoidin domain-containing protein [Rhizobium rosettiformans]MBB5277794.1 hypothetical protein [Rhizobium rosettiformans]THV32955.1 discoidin domain-containing protein [Rhizobium rosettiformans W3]
MSDVSKLSRYLVSQRLAPEVAKVSRYIVTGARATSARVRRRTLINDYLSSAALGGLLPMSLPVQNADASKGVNGWTARAGTGPLVITGIYAHSGNTHFAAGSELLGRWDQDIEVPVVLTPRVDAGLVMMELSAYRAAWTDADESGMYIEMLNGAGKIIASEYQPRTDPANNSNPVWAKDTLAVFLAPQTRTVRVGVWHERDSGTESSTYFDDFEVMFKAPDKTYSQVFYLEPDLGDQIGFFRTEGTTGNAHIYRGTANRFLFPGFGLDGTGEVYRDFTFTEAQLDLVGTGGAEIDWTWLEGQYPGGADTYRVQLIFLDENDAPIAHDPIESSAGLTAPAETWTKLKRTAVVPVQARKVRLIYTGGGSSGSNRDGYFAHMRLVISVASIGGALLTVPSYDDLTTMPVKGAWGLRRLISTYSGPIVRLRNQATNEEVDLGSTNNGNLAKVPDAAAIYKVVRLYDQSGLGSDLVQTTAARQPEFRQAGSPNGRPIMKFDGAGTHMIDVEEGTNRPYMIPYPNVVWLGGAGSEVGSASYQTMWGIPQAWGSNSPPYFRTQVGWANNQDTALVRNAAVESNIQQGTFGWNGGWGGWITWAQAGRIQPLGIPVERQFGDASTPTTYPNSTRMVLGGGGLGTTDAFSGFFTEMVVLEGSPNPDVRRTFRDEVEKVLAASVMGDGTMYRIYLKSSFGGYERNGNFSEVRLFNDGGEVDLTDEGGTAFSSKNFSTGERERNAINNNLNDTWTAGADPVDAYWGVSLNGDYKPSRMDIVNRNAYTDYMPDKFEIQQLTKDGWRVAADVNVGSQGHSANQLYVIEWVNSDF